MMIPRMVSLKAFEQLDQKYTDAREALTKAIGEQNETVDKLKEARARLYLHRVYFEQKKQKDLRKRNT